ncbi:MAG: hypothetical protein LAT58_01950 [Opitutales bacterium]|nr:hypothetical protein [Opitutales bacterium]
MLKSHLPLTALLTLALPAFLMASWSEDFDYPEGDLFPSSDWSFTRDSTPPQDAEEPADHELFEIIPGNAEKISSAGRDFIYRTPFMEKKGGDSVLIVRAGSGTPRAVYDLPESLHIGPGEDLYFSVLTQDLGGNAFGWFAFGDSDTDDPSLGFRQSGDPLLYAARARNLNGFSEQIEGAPLSARKGKPNMIVGKITLGKNPGDPDRVAILLNPESHRDMHRWQSVAEKDTGLNQISTLWIRKGNVGGETVLDRIRLGHFPEEVMQNRSIEYQPLFGARNLARGQEAPRGLKVVKTPTGEKQPEFWLHQLPEAPEYLEWRIEFSENLQDWDPLEIGQSLASDKEIPNEKGLGQWQKVRHENGSGSLPNRGFYRVRAEVQNEPFENSVTATLQVNETFQTIDGFGGSLAYSAQNITDELADLLFSETEGLGFSLARIRINFRNTDADGNVEPNSWEWRAALKAQERGASVWASPWSAHGDLKGDAKEQYPHKGGRLKDDEYGTYAQNLVDFVQWTEDQGLNLIAISPQNEPDYRYHNNESMDWEPAELMGFITDHFRPALNTAGYEDLPIVSPELMDWHRKSGWQDFYTHPETDILAFHNYDWSYDFFNSGNDTRYPKPVATDKPIWLTEISDVFSGEDYTDTIEDALVWARHIHRVIAEVGGTAWHWWWFAPAAHGDNNNETILATRAGVYSGGEPIEGEPEALKRGYGMGQFARFVRPGDQRIGIDYPAEDHEHLLLSAYKGRDKVTVVAINENDSPENLILEDIPANLTMTTAWATTEDKDLASLGHMPREGNTPLEITLPAQSIVTLVFQ